jgi:hypothetical protein
MDERRILRKTVADRLNGLDKKVWEGTVKEQSGEWLEGFARFGYVAKGVVYILIGLLSALAALRQGGEITGTKGALQNVVEQPFGKIYLAIIAFGLAGYVLWRWTQAFLDADRKGTDAKGLGVRAFYTLSGLFYASLTLGAVKLILGSGGGAQEGASSEMAAKAMSQASSGRWLVGAAGLLLTGVAGYQFYRAWTAKFRKRLKSGDMTDTQDKWATRLGRIGYSARGVVFALMGVFIVRSALHANPGEARDLAGALKAIEDQPYGPALLGVVALGLVAFGVFQLVMARYRNIRIE